MSESKELTVPERAAIAVGAAEHEKHLIELSTKYADITKIANVAGRDQVHAGYMELKNARVAIEKAGKDAREDANAFQKAVIEEVKRLTAITTEEEARLQALRDEYDAEREREKAAKAAAEKARVDGIRNRIDEIKSCPAECVGRSAVEIQGAIDTMTAHEITLEEFAELAGEAEVAKIAALAKLNDALVAQQAHEAEAQRLAEERAALEAERKAQAERQRQIDQTRALDEQLAREARERAEAKQRAEHEAAEARLKAERERIAADQRAAQEKADAAERAERQAAARTQAAMSEIQGIQQQVMIATLGRSGVRKGGTIECIRETLAETEAWEIDPERFGMLAGAAEMAKATAVAEIRRMLIDAEALEQAAAEDRRKREAEAAEQARREREAREAAEAEARERERREREQFAVNGPGDVEIVLTLAANYGVAIGDVMQWMKKFNCETADEQFAAMNACGALPHFDEAA